MDEIERIMEEKRKKLLSKVNEVGEVIKVSSIEEIVQKSKEKLVLVDMWAPWCAPCRMLSPILERLSKQMNFVVAKLNVDEHQADAQRLGVQGIPSVFFVKNGEIVDKFVGLRDVSFISEMIKKHL